MNFTLKLIMSLIFYAAGIVLVILKVVSLCFYGLIFSQ